MRKLGGKQGFTLVELSLAVGFIALLSLTIALIINDTVATYRRGLTLNQINTTGMDLVDDFRAAIQSSPSRKVTHECEALFGNTREACENDNARGLVTVQRYANVNIENKEVNLPVYGAICTGAFSYIWNSGYFFGQNAEDEKIKNVTPAQFTYDFNTGDGVLQRTTIGDKPENRFRLLKIKDNRRAVCKSVYKSGTDAYGDYATPATFRDTLSGEFDISQPNGAGPGAIVYYEDGLRESDIEILLKDDATNPLAFYDFNIDGPVSNTADEAAFYAVSFVLGTLDGGLNVNAMGNFCQTPSDWDNNFNYCAINKFNFAAQATGG